MTTFDLAVLAAIAAAAVLALIALVAYAEAPVETPTFPDTSRGLLPPDTY